MRRFRLAITFFFLIVATAIACKTDGDCEADAGDSDAGILRDGHHSKYVNATSYSYDAEDNDWDLKAAKVSCWKSHADKPLSWRKKYGWAGFSHGSKGKKACGKCIEVTNPETKVKKIVRIVDKHTKKEGLVLDDKVFRKLDGSENDDKLLVKYKFVNCED